MIPMPKDNAELAALYATVRSASKALSDAEKRYLDAKASYEAARAAYDKRQIELISTPPRITP